MDEARTVLARLERIEELERSGVPAREVLGELRLLLVEAEAFVRTEHAGTERAAAALTACGQRLDGDLASELVAAARRGGRTLLA